MSHCEERSCLGSLDSEDRCNCPCAQCLLAKPAQKQVRLFLGGFWFVGKNAWTAQRNCGTLFGYGDEKALAVAKSLYPNAWTIADPPVTGPVHCLHPATCARPRNLSDSGSCLCGCPDCVSHRSAKLPPPAMRYVPPEPR